MIYVAPVGFLVTKNNAISLKSTPQPLPPSEGDSINFGQNPLSVAIRPISMYDKFLAKILGQTLKEEIVIDKFGKKSIERTKNGLLYEKILFKTTLGEEYPHLLLKYKKGKVVGVKEFQEDGTVNFDRKYNSLGKKIKEIFFDSKGKKPASFGF